MPKEAIRVFGARQHNLKGFDVEIPLKEVTVITGVSGSGKSSLAFDTLYAEGQRRYCETFSPYARQFMDRMDRPAVDKIEGIPPAIAIQGTNSVRSSRSTVGTVTEITDYLKLLYSKVAVLYCEGCGRQVKRDSPKEIWKALSRLEKGTPVVITFSYSLSESPLEEAKTTLMKLGFHRILKEGKLVSLENNQGDGSDHLEVVVDRFPFSKDEKSRIVDSMEMGFRFGRGRLKINLPDDILGFSSDLHCPYCDITYRDPLPNLFSFNSPLGACETCKGFGRNIDIDMDLVIPDPSKSIAQGAIKPWTIPAATGETKELLAFCRREGIPVNCPFKDLPEEQKRAIIEGTPKFYGIRGFFKWLETKTYKMHVRVFLSRYRIYVTCSDCAGTRFKQEALRYRINGKDLGEILSMTIGNAHTFFQEVSLGRFEERISTQIMKEIQNRLRYLVEVGLEYLTLDRQSRTLSGGEVERVHLTTALGSSLVNTLFVLDEPSIGLHPRDNQRLIGIIKGLKDHGNTVLVVEHDPDIIREADNILDLGPGPGEMGGDLVYFGKPGGIGRKRKSLTGAYLAGRRHIPVPEKRRKSKKGKTIRVFGATAHNLKSIDVAIPLGVFVCITGVSGSGKSTFVEEVLYKGLKRAKGELSERPGPFRKLEGEKHIEDVILVDQKPIGNTPRANPLTYLKVLDPIRRIFSNTEGAKKRDFDPGHFSFNVPLGRCERCRGEGYEKVEMQFLSDIFIKCPDCLGRRFKDEVLAVTFRGKSIADIMSMTASEATSFFSDFPKVVRAIDPLIRVGLGYLRLGQPINTLSGGESQRLKLARYFGTKKGSSLFILDEPTTGLHLHDIDKLLSALQLLIKEGHSIVVVEHNVEVVKCADHVIDLGPEGGERGGEVVVEGSPEQVAGSPRSWTGLYLAKVLNGPLSIQEEERPYISETAMSDSDHSIRIAGAREHNLNGVNLSIPREKFVVITGVSGSGKSTLAFDIIFSEGQRRYLESLSSYVRQYLKVMDRPDCDLVTGIPPTVAIDQRSSRGQKRSTVATVTEIYHYLRLLYSKIGIQHCHQCGREIAPMTEKGIMDDLLGRFPRKKIALWAPKIMGRKGFHKEVFARAKKRGYQWVRVDGEKKKIDSVSLLSRYQEHDIDILIGEIDLNLGKQDALEESLKKAIDEGKGTFHIETSAGERAPYSLYRFCPRCRIGFDDLDPRLFSFNSRLGACPECEGIGIVADFDEELILSKDNTPIGRGAIRPLATGPLATGRGKRLIEEIAKSLRIPPAKPSIKLSKRERNWILYGRGSFKGVVPRLWDLLERTDQEGVINHLAQFMVEGPCPGCNGHRLNPKALSVRVKGLRISDVVAMTVSEAESFWSSARFAEREDMIASIIVSEMISRLHFLNEVGLSYLGLDRRADTLSGGEAQRIRLAAQLGSNLRGVCYILDEPTIGLHPRDNLRLLQTLFQLRDQGNSILVVEHDEETIRRGDYIIDLGPGAGSHGGNVVATGTLEELRRNPLSITGRYINGDRARHLTSRERGPKDGKWLKVLGARQHNLKDIDVSIPLGTLTCITGVSGSGKSTLLNDIFYPALKNHLFGFGSKSGAHRSLEGWEHIARVLEVDHSPIGRTPRSIPASYVGFLTEIRQLFASLPEARARGYHPGRFSFNVRGGRCETCAGQGSIRMEMNFLPDVYVICETCGGKRFNEETLSCRFKGKTISEVLSMTIEKAEQFFRGIPKVRWPLETLNSMGLGYLNLGQASPSLSGGEAQRIKLACELSKTSRGKNLYFLDEPTTGLHLADIEKLIEVFQRLVDRGDTVVVIEHHLDIIAAADYIVDLGPEGGELGGYLVAQGTPREILTQIDRSYTAQCLKQHIASP